MAELPGLLPPDVDNAPLRRALDSLREGFQIIGPDWKYIYVNPAAARHGRRPPHELVGRTMEEAYPGITTTPLFERLHRCMHDRTNEVFENRFTFPDGTSRWFEIRVQPVPEGICIYSADIEARKEAELHRPDATARSGLRRLLERIGLAPTRSRPPSTPP